MSKEKKWYHFNKKDGDPSISGEPGADPSPAAGQKEESTASIVEDVFREAKEKASKKAARRAEEAARQAEEEKRRRENQHEIMQDRDLWLMGFAAPMLAAEGVKELNYDCILRKTDKEKQELKKRLAKDYGIEELSQITDVIRSLVTPYPAEEDPILNAVYRLPLDQWRDAFVNASLCTEDHVDNAIEDIRFALQGMRAQNFAPPVGTLRAWDYAQAAYLTLVGYGMGILPKYELVMIFTRISLLSNWFYNSWNQYVSGFHFGRRVALAMSGKRYNWDDRDLKALAPLLNQPDGNYIMRPIAFGITDFQRKNYSLRFHLLRDGETIAEQNQITKQIIEENLQELEARPGSFLTVVPNMLLGETNQMVVAKMADSAPQPRQEEEGGEEGKEDAPQGPVYLVELQFPKKKFVMACAQLFTREKALAIFTDYCLDFKLPNISDWQSLSRTWEEVRGDNTGADASEESDTFDTPAEADTLEQPDPSPAEEEDEDAASSDVAPAENHDEGKDERVD